MGVESLLTDIYIHQPEKRGNVYFDTPPFKNSSTA